MRLRRDIKFARMEELELPDDRDQEILVDEAIRLAVEDSERQYPHPSVALSATARTIPRAARPGRRTGAPPTTIELVTNNGTWDAETIGTLYKVRHPTEKIIETHAHA